MPKAEPSHGKRLLEWTVLSFLVVTLNFSGHFAMVFDAKNRFFMHWGTEDALALLAVVSSLALAGVLVCVVVAALRSRWVTRLGQHVFVLALISGLLTLYPFPWSLTNWSPVTWLPIMAVLGFSLAHPRSKLVRVARATALILAPLVPILFVTVLSCSHFDAPPQSRATLGPASAGDKTPVFVILFDGWSYEKSTTDGQFSPFFENVRKLAAQSFVFHNAHSAGVGTKISLPKILYQRDIRYDEEGEIFQPWFHGEPPGDGFTSLFERARSRGYKTALVGVYFPYMRIFGDQLDYGFTRPFGIVGQTFGEKMLGDLANNTRYLKDPIFRRLDKPLIRRFHSRNSYRRSSEIFDAAYRVCEDAGPGTFAFFHLLLPHWPYVFNPDGSYFGHEGRDYRGPSDEAGYMRHLEFLDRVVGELVERLRRAGTFDRALIIITSDHASLAEKTPREVRTHVPLLIKLPEQQTAYDIETPIVNDELAPIIEAALDGTGSETAVLKMVREPVVSTTAIGAP